MKPAPSFDSSPEFAVFKDAMRTILKVPKVELDRRVAAAKQASPRKNNPSAAGRKRAVK